VTARPPIGHLRAAARRVPCPSPTLHAHGTAEGRRGGDGGGPPRRSRLLAASHARLTPGRHPGPGYGLAAWLLARVGRVPRAPREPVRPPHQPTADGPPRSWSMPAAAPAHRLRTGEADPSSVANPDLFRVDRPAPVVEFRQDSPRDRAAVGERRAARPPSGALPDAAGGTTDETARLHRPGGLRRRGHAPLRRPIPRSTSPRRGVRGCRPSERATPGGFPWSARAGAVAAGRSGRSASAVATTVRWSGSSPARPASERRRGSGPGQGRGRTRAGSPAGDRGPLPRR
jgi:hypothetical protein